MALAVADTPDEKLEEVASFEAARGRHFLRRLKQEPFVAVVFDGDTVRVFTKGVHPETARKIQALVEMLEPESDND